MALSLSLSSRISLRFERYFGQKAYAHLFVTTAMRDYLVKSWDLQSAEPLFYTHFF
jgi:beta-1,4-mannosyltransferase